jgi:uncharacterized alkaline shock family protein YloU
MEGQSVISPEVLARYAADAAAEVPGVQTKQRRPARVLADGVEVHLVVDHGANLPQVAGDVQAAVLEYLGRMAGARPAAVHVVVDDVMR